MADDNSNESEEEQSRAETEPLLAGQPVEKGDFDKEDEPEGLYHG